MPLRLLNVCLAHVPIRIAELHAQPCYGNRDKRWKSDGTLQGLGFIYRYDELAAHIDMNEALVVTLHDTIQEQEGPEARYSILILWQIQRNLSVMKNIANQGWEVHRIDWDN
jgi:hypothetical protein